MLSIRVKACHQRYADDLILMNTTANQSNYGKRYIINPRLGCRLFPSSTNIAIYIRNVWDDSLTREGNRVNGTLEAYCTRFGISLLTQYDVKFPDKFQNLFRNYVNLYGVFTVHTCVLFVRCSIRYVRIASIIVVQSFPTWRLQ